MRNHLLNMRNTKASWVQKTSLKKAGILPSPSTRRPWLMGVFSKRSSVPSSVLLRFLAVMILMVSSQAILGATTASAQMTVIQSVQRSTEAQIRKLIEPLLDKYCHEECKLLSVTSTVDLATPEEVAPGFDELQSSRPGFSNSGSDLVASSARIKLLMNDKVGPVSRTKLLELVQQFLDTLDYPVKVDTQLAHFPQPVGSESRVAELREKVVKQFRTTLDDLFNQFCPEQCLLADFQLSTELVNAEETQYGQPC